MRTLPNVQRLSDQGGQFLIDVRCRCGYACWIRPKELARRFGWDLDVSKLQPRLRCSKCGSRQPQVRIVAEPRPRGVPKNPH
jgi:hypothetical protein